MKRVHSILSTLLSAMLILSLFGCTSKGITKDEAKAYINDFYEAIEAGNYEKAETYFHPERPIRVEDYINAVEADTNLDFQSGIEIKKYTSFSSSMYDSSVEGSTYTLDMRAAVDDSVLHISAEIVRNENGYGIYNFDIIPIYDAQ